MDHSNNTLNRCLSITMKNAFHLQQPGIRNKSGMIRVKQLINDHSINRCKQKNTLKNNAFSSSTSSLVSLSRFNQELLQQQAKFSQGKNISLCPQESLQYKNQLNNFSKNSSEQGLDHNCQQKVNIFKKYNQNKSKILKKHKTEGTLPNIIAEDQYDNDSIEQIDQNIPGPGSYNLSPFITSQENSSKMQKFGASAQRFQFRKNFQAQSLINPKYPNFKKKSQAAQDCVAFGKSIKEQQKMIQESSIFYENVNTMQNICKKKVYKQQKKDNIGFQSCKQRFIWQRSSQYPSQQEEIYEEEQKENSPNIKPTNAFSSTVKREFPINKITEKADFYGQSYNCLASQLKKQRQYLQDFSIQFPAFMTNEERFKSQKDYKIKSIQKQLQEELNKLYEKSHKQLIKNNKIIKGTIFGKQIGKRQLNLHKKNPSPDQYDNPCTWIRRSYNIKSN